VGDVPVEGVRGRDVACHADVSHREDGQDDRGEEVTRRSTRPIAETDGHGHVTRHRGDRGRRGDRHEDDLEESYGVGLEPAVLLGARARHTVHTGPGCFSAFQCLLLVLHPGGSDVRFLTNHDRPREFPGSAVPSTLLAVFPGHNQSRSSHILCHDQIYVRERFSRCPGDPNRTKEGSRPCHSEFVNLSEYKTPFCGGLQNSSRGEWYSAGRADRSLEKSTIHERRLYGVLGSSQISRPIPCEPAAFGLAGVPRRLYVGPHHLAVLRDPASRTLHRVIRFVDGVL
jgi:hypothetical protein